MMAAMDVQANMVPGIARRSRGLLAGGTPP
jgi:hypothetical protein